MDNGAHHTHTHMHVWACERETRILEPKDKISHVTKYL